MLPILFAPLLTGCVVYEAPFSDDISAQGVTMLVADVDRGSLDYRGVGTMDRFEIDGVSQGTAAGRWRSA